MVRGLILSAGAVLAIGVVGYGTNQHPKAIKNFPPSEAMRVEPVPFESLLKEVPARLRVSRESGETISNIRLAEIFRPPTPTEPQPAPRIGFPRGDVPPFSGALGAGSALPSLLQVVDQYPSLAMPEVAGPVDDTEVLGLVKMPWAARADDLTNEDRRTCYRSALQYAVRMAIQAQLDGDDVRFESWIVWMARLNQRVFESAISSDDLDFAAGNQRMVYRRLALLFAYGDEGQNRTIIRVLEENSITEEILKQMVRQNFEDEFVRRLAEVRFPDDLSQYIWISSRPDDIEESRKFGRWFSGNPRPFDAVATQQSAAELYDTILSGISSERSLASKKYVYARSTLTGQISPDLTVASRRSAKDFEDNLNVLQTVPNVFGKIYLLRSKGPFELSSEIFDVLPRQDEYIKLLKKQLDAKF